ncbi:tRNA pseudouridine synthase A [Arthrobacter dokdonensis]|uniref:tRNA pseudouridine synthase A n=1 Tax=Arthrobacter dokdonellae TaxID=2211210 RepID=UPI000DE59F32|nr:tRNA pseudouridine synthase A [Arthrobacter dokdonellae]
MNHQKPAVPHVGGGGFRRVRLDLAYDGGPFSGWAIQPGRRTVQGAVEDSLAMLLRRPVRLTVAGRTDAGVHARGQVAHLDVTPQEWDGIRRGHDVEPADSFKRRLNGALGRVLGDLHGAVEVLSAAPAPEGFDARFSALWRRYSYRIADASTRRDPLRRAVTLWHRHDLDVDLMNQAARPLLGLQDFKAFAKPRVGSTTVRTLQRLDYDRGPDGVINVNVQADAFCHNMVRALTGAALRVGERREEPDWMHRRLLAGVRDAKSVLAAPHPLVLEEVHYPDDPFLLQRAILTRARRGSPAPL